jgi:hypothetical protein
LKGAPEGLKLDIKNAKLKRGETVLATITSGNPVQVGSKYLMLPLDKVASGVSTKPLFTPADSDRLIFPTWGKQEVFGVPFDVIDPKGDSVKNAIVLYGPKSPLVRELPTAIKLKCGSPAKAIHLLSGVCGWGWGCDDPEGNKKTVCMIVRLHYRDGGEEDHELINGVHFCVFTNAGERKTDVPGSRLAIRLIEPPNCPNHINHIRYLAIEPKERTKVIEEIEFIKGMKGDVTAPVIMAVTVEKPGDALAEPPPAKKPPDGAVAWFRGDGDAKDSVGENHGELKGGVTFSPGIAGKAFRLDGANRYVEVPRSDRWGFGKRDFSIELWVQYGAVQTDVAFIGCDEGPTDRDKWFFSHANGFLFFHINSAGRGNGFYLAKTPFSPALDQWYHLVVTRSRGTFTIYVNGAPSASENAAVVIPCPDAPLIIGQAECARFFNGLIDEVAIYDRALSPKQVKARWSALAPAKNP